MKWDVGAESRYPEGYVVVVHNFKKRWRKNSKRSAEELVVGLCEGKVGIVKKTGIDEHYIVRASSLAPPLVERGLFKNILSPDRLAIDSSQAHISVLTILAVNGFAG